MSTTTAEILDGTALAQGRKTQLSTTLIGADRRQLSPNPWAAPGESEVGFSLSSTVQTDLRATFHANARGRSVWFVIDETASPVDGAYSIEIDGTVVTYTASSVADIDTLLDAIVDEVNNDAAVSLLVLASKVKHKDTSGSYDAIRVVALDSDATPASGLPSGGSYSTFSVGASTSFPEEVELYVVREVDSASLRVWDKRGYSTTTSVDANMNGPASLQQDGWAVASNGEIGALPTQGYDERWNFASRSAVFLELYDLVTTDETFSIASSGDGIYGVVNHVTAVAAPAIL